MTRDEFAGLIEEALTLIPDNFREAMRNIAIIVEDDPPDQLLE
jgi:predicted Zn-dependent protease with MMP-like domain